LHSFYSDTLYGRNVLVLLYYLDLGPSFGRFPFRDMNTTRSNVKVILLFYSTGKANNNDMRSEILTAMNMPCSVYWDVTSYILVGV
jgi:hypothetical protein